MRYWPLKTATPRVRNQAIKKTIIITGFSLGIGKAIALYLAKQGFDLALRYRTKKDQAETVISEIEQLGLSARLLQFDIADRLQCAEQINQDIEIYGAYDGVACNVGITADIAFPADRSRMGQRDSHQS
ncbi:SDR family NAD(P)-dependent oxidoreductase [Methyloglobulus sp.]|uniref:SDR family NAD(P)-dependent oxidoreductase n=1 Tax=Methyloglobulus sp. TaxID=2518622 RepID=UPI003989638F